ncbi:MAG: class I SAM-dependent methyltransferase [Betaproteobacteria bacterium]|nr:MAG: class I SAM-dependent methyltransferase [Betaproteobacteria bacterium]
MPTKLLNSLAKHVRKGVRRIGFDIVRYRELPRDLDPRIANIIREACDYSMTSAQRILTLCEAVQYVVENKIEGDIVECGVWRGGSMLAAIKTLQFCGEADRTCRLFDTFEGMTPPTTYDVEFDGKTALELLNSSDRNEADSFWCYAPLEGVKALLAETGYSSDRLVFVKGRVEDTLPASAPGQIALLRLDTDWYESTKHELEHLYPKLVTGGVLIVDDYGHWQGAHRAVDEYISEHRLALYLHRVDYSGRCAIKVG